MLKEELNEKLRLHSLWIESKPNGVRLELSNADLRYADLRYADLRYADLKVSFYYDIKDHREFK